MKNVLSQAPAGEGTMEARMVAVARAAIAAQIRQGRPLTEILPALLRAAAAEDLLLAGIADRADSSYSAPDLCVTN